MKTLIITTGGTIGQEKDENHISISTDIDHSMDFFESDLIPKDIEIDFENLLKNIYDDKSRIEKELLNV